MAEDKEVLGSFVDEVKRNMKYKRRNKKGRFSDREHLSKEKHERDYVKRVARTWNERLEDYDSSEKVEIRAGQLRRMSEFILQ